MADDLRQQDWHFDKRITVPSILMALGMVATLMVWVFTIRDGPSENRALIQLNTRAAEVNASAIRDLRQDLKRDIGEIKEDVKDIREKVYEQAKTNQRSGS